MQRLLFILLMSLPFFSNAHGMQQNKNLHRVIASSLLSSSSETPASIHDEFNLSFLEATDFDIEEEHCNNEENQLKTSYKSSLADIHSLNRLQIPVCKKTMIVKHYQRLAFSKHLFQKSNSILSLYGVFRI